MGWLLALLGVGVVGAIVVSSDTYETTNAGGAGGVPGGGYTPPPVGDVTCEQALGIVRSAEPAAGAALELALRSGTNVASLRALALELEKQAGAAALTPDQRAAFIKLAKCLRDRADSLEAPGAVEGGISKDPKFTSAAGDGYAPAGFTAAPPKDDKADWTPGFTYTPPPMEAGAKRAQFLLARGV